VVSPHGPDEAEQTESSEQKTEHGHFSFRTENRPAL
jgi:hypothetical protein